MYELTLEEQSAAKRMKEAEAERRDKTDRCPVEWGHCSETNPRYWGKPTDTPHICSGPATHIRRGIVKLHICEKCKHLGGRTMPSPYSKAGAQLRAAILNLGGVQ